MRLLLDTHVLLWWLGNDAALSERARGAIEDADNVVAVSAASAWEIAIKHALGKLDLPADLSEQISANRFMPLAISVADGVAAGGLPRHHDDPFDRMLVAQAQAGRWTVMTVDQRFSDYELDLFAM